ncbi:hypothetical protein [Actinoplanes sp. M2I2]|uniref:hypothetical protein n=1 Tax=Actinoplanes sp. M2I2 TaxID=1734444 RepID=UPI002021EA1A|nr:hypothetical protein [Actinoplanes sp. M2I2]
MASGALTIGSRTPVAGLPAWVTPEVLRGGFATGTPAAGGPLRPHEAAVGDDRGAVFVHYLTDAGQSELCSLLDDGAYRLEFAEQAALLTVAWLLRSGDRAGALALLEEIGPYAGQLSFSPVPETASEQDPSEVWRADAGEVRQVLADRRENARIETMREATTVWNPFADELLALWLETAEGGVVAGAFPDGWRERAEALLTRYEELAARHTRCSRHRKPKENLAVLRAAAHEVVRGDGLTPRRAGLLRSVVASMVARRGRPGSPEHAALRLAQARVAGMPGHHLLARVVVSRVAVLDPAVGIRDVAALCVPVREAEARDHRVPAGTPIPASIQRVVRRATAGRVDDLIDAGVLPSAEVLAELVPQLAAETNAAAYPDPALRKLMAATYRAFRARRSLLLLDLQHQVRLSELPWVRAVRPYREDTDDTRGEAGATLRRLGELAVDGFPATLVPNPLVRELAALSRAADLDLPWVEELAADIFMGRFSPKFLRAAHLAGELLAGSLYARYYDIDFAALPAPGDGSAAFDALCHVRAAVPRGHRGSVAGNGMVIEQAQILTTHNLATLVRPVGVSPTRGWAEQARRTFATVLKSAERIERHPRPLPLVKDIAYAWRHLVFFLSLPGAGDPGPLTGELRSDLAGAPPGVRTRIEPVLNGLDHVARGGRLTEGERLLGWTTGAHRLLPVPATRD